MPQLASDEFARHLEQVRAEDRAARLHRTRENDRRSGARWSGLTGTPLAPRLDEDLQAAALLRLTEGRVWREHPEGGFVNAIAAAQRAAERLHAGVEQARAAAARGLAGERERCVALLGDLRHQAHDLAASLRAAGAALDRLEP